MDGRRGLSRRTMPMMTLHSRHTALLLALLFVGCAPLTLPQKPATPSASGSTQQTSQGPTGEGDEIIPSNTSGAVVAERVVATGTVEIGAADAPVSLMLFTNHYCAYCRDFQEELMPRLTSDYVTPGKVKVTIVPFLLQKYAESDQASLTFVCAAQQGKGLPMHDLLFRERINSPAFNTAVTEMKIDKAQLQSCIDGDGARSTVDALQAVAHSLGVRLVPAYFIDGTKFTGLPEYADLRGQIEEGLGARD